MVLLLIRGQMYTWERSTHTSGSDDHLRIACCMLTVVEVMSTWSTIGITQLRCL